MRRNKVAKTRKLSIWRLFLSLIIIAGLAFGAFTGTRNAIADFQTSPEQPWFAPYVDVTATPTFQFQQMGSTNQRDAMLSFIVAAKSGACTPSWGDAYSMSQADDDIDLATRIARLQQQGGSVAISFGGRDNSELAVNCTDTTALINAYQSVISHYNINTIDFDLEEGDLTNASAMTRRAEVISNLQKTYRGEGKKLAIWLTLPVTPQGLNEAGTNAVSTFLSSGVDLAGVNLLTMDYGSSLTSGQTLLSAIEGSATGTERQLGILYDQANLHQNTPSLWHKIGLTPMIGQNDATNEVFSLKDAASLNSFATSHNVGRMSMWSANRDATCGSNYVDIKVVSDSCSGIDQKGTTFTSLLAQNFNGNISLSAGLTTSAEAKSAQSQAPDNPATSPYQIWSLNGAYLEGTKVVWHHNIYEAKWWTQGDTPDDPVLQSWQTPWQLIGPVLPGEKPIAQPTLPAGTYPTWTGTATYDTGQRVLFNNVPYQAKWWNQGQSPAAASSDPDNSPWTPLTQAQIDAVESTTK
jgi:chitinase